MTPSPAGPIVAPSGKVEAATSVGVAAAAAPAGASVGTGAGSAPVAASSLTSRKVTPAPSAIRFSCTSSEAVSSSPGTALPSTTSCW